MVRWGDLRWGEFYWTEGVVINGIFKEYVYGLVISDLLTKEANTCSFSIDGTYANKPQEGQEVVIKHLGEKIFAGRIVTIEPIKLAGDEFTFNIECTDWQVDLDKRLVIEVYEGKTLNYIVNDINTKYCAGFTTTNVADPGATINRIQFNYTLVSEAFAQIADMATYDWYVDYDKDIHFFPIETNIAPIELLDGGTEFDELVITPDHTQIANKIWVRGGIYLSDEYEQDIITAIATQKEFPTAYKPHELSVEVDDGGGYVVKTVGIQFINDEDGTYDFLVNYNESLLKCDKISYPTGLDAGDKVKIKFKYDTPVIALVEDIASQNILKIIEGGDGKHEKWIPDETIETIDQARERGYAELSLYANPLIEGSFTSHHSGWASGQRLHINLTDRNIDEYYMIREVEITAIGGGNYMYTVTFATSLQGFTWLLIKMLDELKPKVIRADTIIDQIIPFIETITPTDAAPSTILTTPPFEWGGGGVPQAIWDEFVWG